LRKLLWSVICALLLVIAWLTVSFHKHSKDSSAYGPSIQTPIGDISIGLPQFPSMGFGTLTQPTTILFMGVDVQYSGAGRGLVADKTALNGRSDTMMLVFLNPPQNKVSVLHIPRDTEAMVGKLGVQKINSANALGGPDLARAAVTNLLGIGVDHYVVMNLQGLVQLVNELGGVTVEVPKKMSYMDWTAKLKIDLDPGWHTLTGNQAMGFVRFRHDDLGDIGRVQRQQVFLQAAERKMLDPRSWVHVPACIDIATKNMQTDMTQADIFQSLNFLHGVPKSNIKFVMLPGQFSGNGDWIATNEARGLAQQLLNPDQEFASNRRNIQVCIKNASSDKALAGKLALALRKLGYVTSTGKDEKDVIYKNTRIIVQNGNSANGNMMHADLGNIGEVVCASVGDLYSKITIIACDDINLDRVQQSSADSPYVVPQAPTPIIPPAPVRILGKHSRKDMQPSASETEIMDQASAPETAGAPSSELPNVLTGEQTPANGTEPLATPTSSAGGAPNPGESSRPYTIYTPPALGQPTIPTRVGVPTAASEPTQPTAPLPGNTEPTVPVER
jgi:LCP family protein required for cell wall assembly